MLPGSTPLTAQRSANGLQQQREQEPTTSLIEFDRPPQVDAEQVAISIESSQVPNSSTNEQQLQLILDEEVKARQKLDQEMELLAMGQAYDLARVQFARRNEIDRQAAERRKTLLGQDAITNTHPTTVDPPPQTLGDFRPAYVQEDRPALATGVVPEFIGRRSVISAAGAWNAAEFRSSLAAQPIEPRTRQVSEYTKLPRLPLFSGASNEWPIFIQAYMDSTRRLGITDSDNIYRLSEALSGIARASVSHLLYDASNLEGLLNSLRSKFGNPQKIANDAMTRIMSLPKIDRDYQNLTGFACEVSQVCHLLKSCGMEHDLQSSYFVHVLEQKLNPHLNLMWGAVKRKAALSPSGVNLRLFCDWLEESSDEMGIVQGFTLLQANQHQSRPVQKPEVKRVCHVKERPREKNGLTKQSSSCLFGCVVRHPAYRCPQFLDMSPHNRLQAVRNHQRCENCLGGHPVLECPTDYRCQRDGCGRRHNSLLHGALYFGQEELVTTSLDTMKTDIIFKIIPVKLYNGEKVIESAVFLDEGSSVTLIDKALADQLHLVGPEEPLRMRWTGNTTKTEKSFRVDFRIKGETGAEIFEIKGARTVNNLNLPRQQCNPELKHIPHLKDLNKKLFGELKPKILLGLDNVHLSFPHEIRKSRHNQPLAARTPLGWTIYGCQYTEPDEEQVHCTGEVTDDEKLENLVTDFLADESFGISNTPKLMPEEDNKALAIMEQNLSYTDGVYTAGLLWKRDPKTLPGSWAMARRRWEGLMKKLNRDPIVKANYNQILENYLAKGYIAKVANPRPSDSCWYLPTFVVQNSTKMRIVWDAAAEVKGTSLNSYLLSGPDLLISLSGVLCQFRENRIALSGDIREMFHQIKIRKEDRPYQRFFWQRKEGGELEVYEMQVMIFLATSSPFMAQFIKDKNAERFIETHPEAVESITLKHYMDDWLQSFVSEELALKRAQEVVEVHNAANFKLGKWKSNSPLIRSQLCGEAEAEIVQFGVSKTRKSKILGLCWDTTSDNFGFELSEEMKTKWVAKETPTKRELLRTVMSLFDPLGLMAFVIIIGKLILRDVWRSNINWDELINEEEASAFQKWGEMVLHVENIKIPRWYGIMPEEEIQMHIFVDASDSAFAAVIYAVFGTEQNRKCVLLGAKAKVASLRAMTIPRLELQAAVLGVRLAKSIEEQHAMKFSRRYFWSDSRDVLCWIRSEKRKYRQFVAFRVAEILNKSKCSEWRWVPTNQNPADLGTKRHQSNFDDQWRMWMSGPQFITQEHQTWPQENCEKPSLSDPELFGLIATQKNITSDLIVDWSRYSDWKKMVRVYAFVTRFINRCREKKAINRTSDCISKEEFLKSEKLLIRLAQQESYGKEISILNDGKTLDKKNSLHQLVPFLDRDCLLRHQGRIQNAWCVNEDTRNPIIIPGKHRIAHLIVQSFHQKYLHANNATVLNEIRQHFFINGLRTLVKQVRRSCSHCIIRDAKARPPQMAELPASRTKPFCAPFSYVGIDYFGPISVAVGRRSEKRWGVLFTCFNTRAVHLEIAHSLTTSSMIMAFRNFTNRRGIPIEVYTDNGTNFRGAASLLQRLGVVIDPGRVTEELNMIQWHFLTPTASHMGGVWERQVRSIKKCLENMALPQQPDDEVLRSYFMEAEGIVNSRPLTYVTLDPNDLEALTPNHFLIGSSSGVKPLPVEKDGDQRRSWRTSQHMANYFWERWTREYLPDLTRRSKWYDKVPLLKVNDVVLIFDEQRRNSWTRGLIVDIATGRRTDQVRRVKVKTAQGEYWRPATKVALLDFAGNS